MVFYLKCCPRVVFIDLDGVVWDYEDISQTNPPYRCIDNLLFDSNGVVVRLNNGVRDFLFFVKNLGLNLYTLSWNDPVKALQAIDCFSLNNFFNGHSIRDDPRKYLGIKRVLSEIGISIKPCEIVYIDDRDIHLNDILENIGNVVFIHMWRGIRDFYELINYFNKVMLNKCREY